nr:MAG TPA: agnoprotein [Caudoviricetes sp.]
MIFLIEYDIVISAMEDCRGGDSVWQKEKEQS